MADVNASESRVLCRRCEHYEDDKTLLLFVREAFALFGFDAAALAGKCVAIKPNLVMKAEPSRAATVHPALMRAVLAVLDEAQCADVVIAESCGGPFHAAALGPVYRATGMTEAAQGHRVRLNDDFTAAHVPYPKGKASKSFHIISAVANADVIISLSKLKSHTLTTMSGAVKNFFGTIPGLEKFEMHARFPDYDDFSEMLTDLCLMHHARARVLNLQDAVVCMEGNGPTGGSARAVGCLFASDNAFALDSVAAQLLGFAGKVPVLEKGKARGAFGAVRLCGEDPMAAAPKNFKIPDSKRDANPLVVLPKVFGNKAFDLFRPRPVIAKNCIGCGECVRSCPVHTIRLEKKTGRDGKNHRCAKIDPSRCIRCFCCQELCPHRCVKIHKNFLIRILG